MQIQNQTLRPSSKLPQATIFQEQLQRILDRSAEGPNLRHLHDVVAIISNTGIRVGELCALRWADVDVHRGMLVVNANTGFTRRVLCGPKTLQILEARRKSGSEYVLEKSPRGLVHRVSRQLRTVCNSIGLSGVTFHVLRRKFFERLMSSGASYESCITIGGWKSTSSAFAHIPLSPDWLLKSAALDLARVEEVCCSRHFTSGH